MKEKFLHIFHNDHFLPKRMTFFDTPKEQAVDMKEKLKGKGKDKAGHDIEGKIASINRELDDVQKMVPTLGTGLKQKLKKYLVDKIDMPKGYDLKNITQVNFNSLIDAKFNNIDAKSLEKLKKLDFFLGEISSRVALRKDLAMRMKKNKVSSSLSKKIGGVFEDNISRFESTDTLASVEQIRSRNEVLINLSRFATLKTQCEDQEATSIENAIFSEDGLLYDKKDGKVEYFRHWADGDKLYSISSYSGKVQRFNLHGVVYGSKADNIIQRNDTGDDDFPRYAPDNVKEHQPNIGNLRDYVRLINKGRKARGEAKTTVEGLQADLRANTHRMFLSIDPKHKNYKGKGAKEAFDGEGKRLEDQKAAYMKEYNLNPAKMAPFEIVKKIIEFLKEFFKTKAGTVNLQTGEKMKGPDRPAEVVEKVEEKPEEETEAMLKFPPNGNILEWGNFTVEKGSRSKGITRVVPPDGKVFDSYKPVILNGVPSSIELDKSQLALGIVAVDPANGSQRLLVGDVLDVILLTSGSDPVERHLRIEVKKNPGITEKDAEIRNLSTAKGNLSTLTSPPSPQQIEGNAIGYVKMPLKDGITSIDVTKVFIDNKEKTGVVFKMNSVTGAIYLESGDLHVGQNISLEMKINKTGGGTVEVKKQSFTLEDLPGPSKKDTELIGGTTEITSHKGKLKASTTATPTTLLEFAVNRPDREITSFTDSKGNDLVLAVYFKSSAAGGKVKVQKTLSLDKELEPGTYYLQVNVGTRSERITINVEKSPEIDTAKDLEIDESFITGPINNSIKKYTKLYKFKEMRPGVTKRKVVDPDYLKFSINSKYLHIKQVKPGNGVPDASKWTLPKDIEISVKFTLEDGKTKIKQHTITLEVVKAEPVPPSLKEDFPEVKDKYEINVGEVNSKTFTGSLIPSLGKPRKGITRGVTDVQSSGNLKLKFDGKGNLEIVSGKLPQGTDAVVTMVAKQNPPGTETVEKKITIRAENEHTPTEGDCTLPTGGYAVKGRERELYIPRGSIGGAKTAPFILSGHLEGNEKVTVDTTSTKIQVILNNKDVTNDNLFDFSKDIRWISTNDRQLMQGDEIEIKYPVSSKKKGATARMISCKITIGNLGQTLAELRESESRVTEGDISHLKEAARQSGIEPEDIDVARIDQNIQLITCKGETTVVYKDGDQLKITAKPMTAKSAAPVIVVPTGDPKTASANRQFIDYCATMINDIISKYDLDDFTDEARTNEEYFHLEEDVIEAADNIGLQLWETNVFEKFPGLLDKVSTRAQIIAVLNSRMKYKIGTVPSLPDEKQTTYIGEDTTLSIPSYDKKMEYRYSLDGGLSWERITDGKIEIKSGDRDKLLVGNKEGPITLKLAIYDPLGRVKPKIQRINFKLKPSYSQTNFNINVLTFQRGPLSSRKNTEYTIKKPGDQANMSYEFKRENDVIQIWAKDTNKPNLGGEGVESILIGTVETNMENGSIEEITNQRSGFTINVERPTEPEKTSRDIIITNTP